MKINQDFMVFLRNNLPNEINDGAYIINLDEYVDVGTHWIALFCNRNEIVSIVLVLNVFLKKLKNLLIFLCPLLRKMKT